MNTQMAGGLLARQVDVWYLVLARLADGFSKLLSWLEAVHSML